jgi:hypothetical protein
MFQNFQQLGVRYIFPASLTLFGDGMYDSKTLMLTAIKNTIPTLRKSIKNYFHMVIVHRPGTEIHCKKKFERMMQKYQAQKYFGSTRIITKETYRCRK